jgi:hypothetical protein
MAVASWSAPTREREEDFVRMKARTRTVFGMYIVYATRIL